jgi:hypothetical protein
MHPQILGLLLLLLLDEEKPRNVGARPIWGLMRRRRGGGRHPDGARRFLRGR